MLRVNLFGQSTEVAPAIKVIANVQKSGVTLKWAPTNALAWQYANKYGYIVERYTIAGKGKVLSKTKKITITQEPITPLPLKDWEKIVPKDKYAAIAAQALYGKTFKLEEKSNNVFQMINKSKELENRFSFSLFCADQSLDVANYMGLKLMDKFLKYGEKYLYKVYTAVPKNIMEIDTGYVFVEADKITPIPVPAQVKLEFGDKTALVSWNKVYYESIFSAYYIERSEDGMNFKRVNEEPYVNAQNSLNTSPERIFYQDSIPENNKTYFYRIVGRTYFGEYSEPSEILKGQGFTKPTFEADIFGANIIDNSKVLLKWTVATNDKSSIKGFRIAASDKVNGKYENIDKTIIPNDTREFILDKPLASGYYIVKVIDNKGNEYKSMPYMVQLKDNLPPVKPVGLKAEIDSLGVLKLKWLKNKEFDIEGYRVYAANNLHEEFSQVTNAALKDTVFYDTINVNTLSSQIFYKVVALDHHFNPSEFSSILTLEKPDKIAPVAPSFSNLISTDTSVFLEWKTGGSKDAKRNILLRSVAGSGEWKEIAFFNSDKVLHYSDKGIEKGITYEYSMVAEDYHKNRSSRSSSVKAKLIDNGVRPELKNVKATADRANKNILLKWDYSLPDVERFFIYRGEAGKPLRLYKSIDAGTKEFKDNALLIDTKYVYQVRAKFKDGSSSPFSKEILVNY